VKPLPETRVVLNTLVGYGRTEIVEGLATLVQQTRIIVPELSGLSLGRVEDGLVFTLVASSVDVAAIDAAQYLDGGPCVEATAEATIEAWTLPADAQDLHDEQRWATYVRATAAAGIASSLSLPVMSDGRAIGSVNLYASTPDAFDGNHAELAKVLGASVTEVVANADLTFSTRLQAAQAPVRLAYHDIQIAVGIIAERLKVNVEDARERLADSAERAAITQLEAARALIETLTG
jgi:GAF domain-containing protein